MKATDNMLPTFLRTIYSLALSLVGVHQTKTFLLPYPLVVTPACIKEAVVLDLKQP